MSKTVPCSDVITGLTPLEERLAGVHPRLHFRREDIERIRSRIGKAPDSGHAGRVLQLADQGVMPNPAMAYLLTGEAKYLDASLAAMRRIIESPDWPQDLRRDGFAGHDKLYNLALGFDWLHDELDDAMRSRALECLNRNGRKHFEALARHEIYQAGIYTCNTLADCLTNTAAAGMAIYGEVDDVGPWMRAVMEKVRAMTHALAPDGVSQEGICYGGFYTDYYVRTLDLVCDLLGWDFFQGNEHLRNVAYFYIYSMLPRRQMTERSAHLCFGDGVRYNWHGPAHFLRKLAAVYRDPHAQWAADVQEQTGATRHNGAFLSLKWHDPSIAPKGPEDLPTFRHFDDKDIVMMRSDWSGDEAVFGFKCGPHAGRHALARYQHCIGGGHMAPDAGSFLLFAHGDWLISDGWYARKFTAYRNTVLVDGVGQTGEPDGPGDWFECTELRRERRGPRILRAVPGAAWDYVIGDAAPAYEKRADLRRFLRHVLYVKPYCWVIADELAAGRPATFELLFHAFGEYFEADRPFVPAGPGAWDTGGANGRLRVTALLPADVEGVAEEQAMLGIGAHHDRLMSALRLHNRLPAGSAVFLTVLEAYPAGGVPALAPRVERGRDGFVFALGPGAGEVRFAFTPGGPDPAAPAFQPLA